MKIRVNGIVLNIQERGAGGSEETPTLMFLHYFGGSSRSWGLVTEQLAGRFRCLALDLRGWGESDAPATGYAMSDYAEDVAALLVVLGVKRYSLVGHSMGGKIALALAARQPPGLDSLVLLAPSPPTPEPMAEDERERLLGGHFRRAAAEATIRKITARSLPAPLFEQAVEDSLRSSQFAWDAWLTHGSREDIAARMPLVTAPALVVSGDADAVIPVRLLQQEVIARMQGARLATLSGTGHLSPLESPVAVAALIEEMLEETLEVTVQG